jgi:glycosyltransferase involved in cell wall biosynthesis
VAASVSISSGDSVDDTNLVSVIIACHNHGQFLGQAIESVLAQSYRNVEIIVVDDGSTDNTGRVATRYRLVRYIYQENAGPSAARNAGLRESHGDFLVFLDADDRLLPNALDIGVSCARAHPECAFVSGHCRVIDSNGAILASPRQLQVERDHYLQLLRGGAYIWCPATVLYQRQIFDFVHGFDPACRVEDYDLYLRITRDFPVYSHGHVIVEYRQHRSTRSRDVLAVERAALAAHDAQWDFVKANSLYREAYDAGAQFWQNDYSIQQMVTRIREIVRERLPPDAAIAVATSGNPELLRLDGRRGWHFPQAARGNVGELFAQGAEGSVATPAWIEPGMTYEFSLYKGTDRSRLLARLLVRGVADPYLRANTESTPQECAHEDGILLAAIPNPVFAGGEPGVTNIIWSTGDGSEGQVYVAGEGQYAGQEPADSDEAWSELEAAMEKGTQYLLIPIKSFWWLDDYREFRERVDARFPAIVRDENTCTIFDLRESSK